MRFLVDEEDLEPDGGRDRLAIAWDQGEEILGGDRLVAHEDRAGFFKLIIHLFLQNCFSGIVVYTCKSNHGIKTQKNRRPNTRSTKEEMQG